MRAGVKNPRSVEDSRPRSSSAELAKHLTILQKFGTLKKSHANTQTEQQSQIVLIIDPRVFSRESIKSLLEARVENCRLEALECADEISLLDESFLDQMMLCILCIGSLETSDHRTKELLDRVRFYLPDTPLLLLGELDSQSQIAGARALDANGYIPTSSDPKTVVHVIEVARVGGLLLPSSMSLDAHAGQQRPAPQQGTGSIAFSSAQTPYANGMSRSDAASQRFTPREKQVLHCLGTGMQNKLIAHELQLRESTVKVHVRNILKKLRVSSRTQAALLAREINTRADAPTMPHRPPTSGALPGELRPRV